MRFETGSFQIWSRSDCHSNTTLHHHNDHYTATHITVDSTETVQVPGKWHECGVRFTLCTTTASLWTQWGQEVVGTLNFYCVIALQLWQHTGLDASWSTGQNWFATVLSATVNSKGKSPQCSIRHHTRMACGMSHKPHTQDTFCSTKKSQLPEAFTILWCYTAYINGWLLMFWDSLISPFFKGQFFGFLDPWSWNNRLSQNDNHQLLLFNISDEWRPQLHCGRNLKSPQYLLCMWLGSCEFAEAVWWKKPLVSDVNWTWIPWSADL